MQMNEQQKTLLEEAKKAGRDGDTMRAQKLWILAHSTQAEKSKTEERTK